jgi:hypothetical protein
MTMWFDRQPGDVVMTAEDEAGGAVMVFGRSFDRVRQPAEIGGRQLKVLAQFHGPCPVCKSEVLHHDLEEDYGVAECMADGFLWYKKRAAETEQP